jgi:voltage-gated potassium channel
MKQIIYKIIERQPNRYWPNVLFDYAIITLIILNVIAIAIETIANLNPELVKGLRIFEIFSVFIFTVEFCMRIYISDIRPKIHKTFKVSSILQNIKNQ